MPRNTVLVIFSYNRPDLTRRRLEQLFEVKCPIIVSIDAPKIGSINADFTDLEIEYSEHVQFMQTKENLGTATHLVARISEQFQKYDNIIVIEDDVAALKQLKEKLSPDGLLLIYVPAFESIWTSMDNKVGHYRRYRQADLRAKLIQAGYQVHKSHYCDSLGFILAFIFKFIGNASGEPSSWSLKFFDRVLLPISKFMDIFLSPFFVKNVFVLAQRKD